MALLAGYWEEEHGEEEARERERKRKEGGLVASLGSPGGHLGGQSGEQEVARPSARGKPRSSLRLKTKGSFANSPLGFGFFSWNKTNNTLLYYLVIQTTLKFSK
jgi:hypothetical protein